MTTYALTVDDAAIAMVSSPADAFGLLVDTVARLIHAGWGAVRLRSDDVRYEAKMRSPDGAHVVLTMRSLHAVTAICPVCRTRRRAAIWPEALQCLVCLTRGSPEEFMLDG